ncbi:Kinesin light chain 3 [Aphanomyces cochlioides]|nr:Kinesin light chain 3 [Aphanomyces cochlioides]
MRFPSLDSKIDRIFSTMGEADQHPSAVSLAYFHRFVEIHGGRDAFQDLTTENVCDRFILPYTESTKLSLVDHVSQEPDGQQYVQPTQWFVSHAWSYRFLDVLDALDNFVEENNLDQRVAFWFCAFNNNQHDIKGQIRSFEFWLSGFQAALTSSRQIVMVLSPWTNPVTLTRTWCVYEVYMSIVLNARFEIAMGKTQKTEFLHDMKAGDDQTEVILQAIATINTQESKTTIQSDRDHIFNLIVDQVGFAKLDQMVLHILLDWMIRTVKHQTESSTDPEERFRWFSCLGAVLTMADKQVEADAAYKTAADIYRQSLPRTFWYGWRICHIEAFSKARLMQPRQVWEPMFNESLPMLEELLAQTIESLFEAYCQFGDYTAGMPLLEDCLASQERVFGRDNVETLRTVILIGMYKSRQNQLIDATEWLIRAYDLHCKIYGRLHSETNICRTTLAVCYARQGKFHQAEPLLQESYDYHWRALGPEHSFTCATLYNLSAILRSNGDYDKAEANLQFCIDNFRKAGDTSWVLHCNRHRRGHSSGQTNAFV